MFLKKCKRSVECDEVPIVKCSYCGNEMYQKDSQVKKAKKHFCSVDHHLRYRREFNYNPRRTGTSHYMKLKKLAEARKS